EHLVLSPAGVPVEGSIEGTSLMGGGVSEHFTWKDGKASWTSQADHGDVQAAAPRLYVGNDASPGALGMYARVLSAAPGRALDVLPAGRMTLEKLRSATVAGQSYDAYLLSGVDLTPEILLLDKQKKLFATLSDSLVVREGFEKEADSLRALG